jgi:Putative metallopeptidase
MMLLLLPFALMFTAETAFAQPVASEVEKIRARIGTASLALGNSPSFKSFSPKNRKGLVEFVTGAMLFVLLHELAHAAISEMQLPVLGKEEDAADSFAATRLIRLTSEFSDRVIADAARGWFMADRRVKKEGEPVIYYDEHSLDIVRAYQIVCYMVGFDENKFADLANKTKLPEDRRESWLAH